MRRAVSVIGRLNREHAGSDRLVRCEIGRRGEASTEVFPRVGFLRLWTVGSTPRPVLRPPGESHWTATAVSQEEIMLVLTRKTGGSIIIDGVGCAAGVVKVTVVGIRGTKVKLGIEADARIAVRRREVVDRLLGKNMVTKAPLTATSRPGEMWKRLGDVS